MKIPVFVSAPTILSPVQESARKLIVNELARAGLEPRALGRSDYPTELPLREVLTIARHCAGGVILGFQQFRADTGVWKEGTTSQLSVSASTYFPTPWNHLEAGILFSLELPLLVFREDGISGGVFDNGVTDVFVHPMPTPTPTSKARVNDGLSAVVLKWQGAVRAHYYRPKYNVS